MHTGGPDMLAHGMFGNSLIHCSYPSETPMALVQSSTFLNRSRHASFVPRWHTSSRWHRITPKFSHAFAAGAGSARSVSSHFSGEDEHALDASAWGPFGA